jgi:hypothetical protein
MNAGGANGGPDGNAPAGTEYTLQGELHLSAARGNARGVRGWTNTCRRHALSTTRMAQSRARQERMGYRTRGDEGQNREAGGRGPEC